MEISNKFFVKKTENIDGFVAQYMKENNCCDKVEMKEINDSWEITFFKKAEKQEQKKENKIMATQGIKSIMDSLAAEMEAQIVAVQVSGEDAKAKMESQSKQFQEDAKAKLVALDATINAKFIEQDKKTAKQIEAAKIEIKAAQDKIAEKIKNIGVACQG